MVGADAAGRLEYLGDGGDCERRDVVGLFPSVDGSRRRIRVCGVDDRDWRAWGARFDPATATWAAASRLGSATPIALNCSAGFLQAWTEAP